MMTERTLRVLEFTKIREMLAEGALTETGAEKCRALVPFDDLASVEAAQAETEEAAVILRYVGGHPMTAFPDIRPALAVCEKGGSLSAGMLLSVAETLRASRNARDALVTDRENTPILRAKGEGLYTNRNLEKDITDAILSEDEIADRASSELMNIRRHLRGAQDRIKERLNQMIRSAALQKALQDPIITVRNDRYVIPVRAEYRSSVPGLVHDQSSSGATLFIEPMVAVEMGNELKQWELKEQQEIARILAALSAEVAPWAAQLRETVEAMGELDFIFAKGLLSRRLVCVAPKMNREGYLHIIRGRHPLIDPEKVVPSTIWLGKEFTTLVVTGPNTGGKTVTLKTTGLLTLMAQAGLQVPADLGTELAVFEQVFADIGDEQSIEQSLSTFSSHMKRIVTILNSADENSLCLFDELGAGTDPTEGAALAIAILDRLHKRHIRTVATTHYSELKIYAIREDHVMNASCEFDVETLRPTYRLLIGMPGKSNAFAISRKLGLPEEVISDAANRLDKKDEDLEDVLSKLEQNRILLEQEQETVSKYRKEAEELKASFEIKQKKLQEMRDRSIKAAQEEAREFLQDAKKLADEAIRLYQKSGGNVSIQEMEEMRKKLREKLNDTRLEEKKEEIPQNHNHYKPSDFHLGDDVKILSMDLEGTVSSIPDAKGNLYVQCGIMRMQTNINDVLLPEKTAKNNKKATSAFTGAMQRSASISTELNLLGLTVDDALAKLDKYLDDASLAHLSKVRIVHGKGTGALRSAVQSHLKKSPYVRSYRLAEYGEGDAGVTIAELK